MAQTEAHLPTSRRVAARKALLSPVNLIPFPVLAVLALARHYHFVADNPLWLLLGTMVVHADLHDRDRGRVSRPARSNARPRLLLTAQIVLIGLCVYANGWGALLAVGFVFAAATAIHSDGSRYALWAMACTALTVAAGELTIALGWVKTMVAEPEGHGLARARGRRRVRGDLDPLATTSARRNASRDRCARASAGSARSCNTRPTSSSSSRPTGP